MMKFSSLVGLLSAAAFDTAYAKFEAESITRQVLSDPKSIGGIHTAAFENLSQKYATKMESSSGAETVAVSEDAVLQDVTEVMYDFCREGDTKCMSNVDNAMNLAIETRMGGTPGEITVEYPADMHYSLTTLLDEMFDTVLLLDEDNLESVMASLTDIQTQLEEVEGGTNPFHNYIARAASSVAIESSQMWHSVYTNPDHPLHHLVLASDDIDGSAEVEEGGRKLQDESNDDYEVSDYDDDFEFNDSQIGATVTADVIGFIIPWVGSLLLFVITVLPIFIPIFGLLWFPYAIIVGIFGAFGTALLSAFTAIAFSAVAGFTSIVVGVFLDDDNSTDKTTIFEQP